MYNWDKEVHMLKVHEGPTEIGGKYYRDLSYPLCQYTGPTWFDRRTQDPTVECQVSGNVDYVTCGLCLSIVGKYDADNS